MNQLLKEKKYLEDCLLKLPENPRTLKDIKFKKEKNERILKIESQIEQIRTKIKLNNKLKWIKKERL